MVGLDGAAGDGVLCAMATAVSPTRAAEKEAAVAVIVAELVSETVTVEVDIAMAFIELLVSESLPEELFLSDAR